MLDLGFLGQSVEEETAKALDEATKARAEGRIWWWALGGALGGTATAYFMGQPNSTQALLGLVGAAAGAVTAKATA